MRASWIFSKNDVYSAGIVAHGKNPRAIAVMQEASVDISGQQLDPAILHELDLLVTVCGNADESCPTVPVSCEKQHWPFDDPAKASSSEDETMAEYGIRFATGLRLSLTLDHTSWFSITA